MRPYQLGFGSTPTLTVGSVNLDCSGTGNVRAWARNVSSGAKVSLDTSDGATVGNDITLDLDLGATGLAVGDTIEVRVEDDSGRMWVPNYTAPEPLLITLTERYAD